MKLKSFCLEFTTAIQINLLSDMATITENTLIIDSPMDLEAELCKYNCKTEKELDELLWYDYGVALILDYKDKEENNV